MKETDTNIENTADINRAKIRRFCGSIIYQLVILTAVVFATVHNNELAQWGVVGYCFFIGIALFSFVVITFSPPQAVALTVLKRNDNWKESLTPSGTVRRLIGTFVTCIEVALLLTHGWIVVGTIWAVAELFQFLSIRKIRIAAEFIEDDNIDLDENTGEIVNAKTGLTDDGLSFNDEFLNPELDSKLVKIQTELDDLDTQLRRLLSQHDGVLPPEGSQNRKDFDELNVRREEVIASIETVIQDAAKDFQQRS